MEQLEDYANSDGTYTSPRNGKVYKSLKAIRAHWYNPGTGGWTKVNTTYGNCKYCNKETNVPNLKKHEKSCYLNPVNIRLCEECNGPIKDYKHSKGTCSHSCSNKHFAHLRNLPERYTQYKTICFKNHEKKCIICGETNIVAVHYYDHNHENNDPANLVPMCPTHHQYVHSRYADVVMSQVRDYVKQFVTGCGAGSNPATPTIFR